jgi:protein SCO1/2
MNRSFRTTEWMVWGGLVLIIAAIAVGFVMERLKMAAPAPAPFPVLGQVANFSLTNQDGAAVTLETLRGRVWVADIIFTRCPGPCPRMTQQMRELQTALPGTSGARFVSLTTDAEYDTPPVLKKYAERFGVRLDSWMFLTGDQKEIANLAIDSLKLTALAKPAAERTSPDDLFVHSTIFVVVDKRGQLRGVFETGGEGVDWSDSRAKILTMVDQLEREP